jgi:hypothetical protein
VATLVSNSNSNSNLNLTPMCGCAKLLTVMKYHMMTRSLFYIYISSIIMSMSLSTRKEALKYLMKLTNPKGDYEMKMMPEDKIGVSWVRCVGGLRDHECTWYGKITCIRKMVNGNRSRKYIVSIGYGFHDNCGTHELLALQQPRKKAKQGGDTIPVQIREDWSTPENKKRMETAIFAVKDKAMSQAQAAVQFGIPASIISKTVNGRRDLDTKSGRGSMLPGEVRGRYD